MPDYPSPYGGSPGASKPNPHQHQHHPSGRYSPQIGGFHQSPPPHPDLYSSMSQPVVAALAPPHMSQVGRTDSSGGSGDKIISMTSPPPPHYHHQFERHTVGHPVPQVIGGGVPSSGPPLFRSSTPGYDHPYNNARYYHGAAGPPPGHPMPTYSYFPPHHHHVPTTWTSVTPPNFVAAEYITELAPNDVLCGRGGATNTYKGNRAFRALVKDFQERYLQAKKRDKPAVASLIVELIRKKSGRFLRRCEEIKGTIPHGTVLWLDIGDDRAREKTCQALREGAPEIRRKKFGKPTSRSYSYDDEDESRHHRSPTPSGAKDHYHHHHSDATLSSPSSTIYRTASNTSNKGGVRWPTEEDSDDEERDHTRQAIRKEEKVDHHHDDGPIRVRPWARLLPERGPVDPIDLDQLSNEDRDLYLRDFLPPDPAIRSSNSNSKAWHRESPAGFSYCDFAESPVSNRLLEDDHDQFGHPSPSPQHRNSDKSGKTSDERTEASPWPLVTA